MCRLYHQKTGRMSRHSSSARSSNGTADGAVAPSKTRDEAPQPRRLEQLLCYQGPVVNVARAPPRVPVQRDNESVPTEVLSVLMGMLGGRLPDADRGGVVGPRDGGGPLADNDMYVNPALDAKTNPGSIWAPTYDPPVVGRDKTVRNEGSWWSGGSSHVKPIRSFIPASMDLGGGLVSGFYFGQVDAYGIPNGSGQFIDSDGLPVVDTPYKEAEINLTIQASASGIQPNPDSDRDYARIVALREDVEKLANVSDRQYELLWKSWKDHHDVERRSMGVDVSPEYSFTVAELQRWAGLSDARQHFVALGGRETMSEDDFAVTQLVQFCKAMLAREGSGARIRYGDFQYGIAQLRAGLTDVTPQRFDHYQLMAETPDALRTVKGEFKDGKWISGSYLWSKPLEADVAGEEPLRQETNVFISEQGVRRVEFDVTRKKPYYPRNTLLQRIDLGGDSNVRSSFSQDFHGKTLIGQRAAAHKLPWAGEYEQVKMMNGSVRSHRDALDPTNIRVDGFGQVRVYVPTAGEYIWLRGMILNNKLTGRVEADRPLPDGLGKDVFFAGVDPNTGFDIVRSATKDDPKSPVPASEPGVGESYGDRDDRDFAKIGKELPSLGWVARGAVGVIVASVLAALKTVAKMPALDNIRIREAVERIQMTGHGVDKMYGPVEDWDTSNVTDMSRLFNWAVRFDGDLSRWDTSKVTNMSYMFYEAMSFNCDLSRWDTSKVTDMSYMFHGATEFNGFLTRWDTSNVTDMSYMFCDATSFDRDISRWVTPKLIHSSRMFEGATRFSGDRSRWGT